MDKLEPILKNHFWILLVPLFSMNLWGYFSANGALKAATSARESALDTVKGAIPNGAVKPNEVYTKELAKQNDALEKYVKEELLDLWKRQQVRMVWPPRVTNDIPKKYMAEIDNNKVRYTYQTDYPDAIRQLHESVEPFVGGNRVITWTPKVDVPVQLIPQMKIGNLTIASKEMWNAQEDIWVTQLILDAIRQMNKDADSETSAVIRRVIAYRLLGGDGAAAGAGGDADSGSMGEEGGMMGQGYAAMAGGGMNGGVGGGQAGGVASSIKFDPAEEFGAGGEAAAGGGGMDGSAAGGMRPSMMMDEEGETAEEGAEPTGPLRYVNKVEGAPFVERGFYLSVIINQNKMVDFLVALSNSDWPVRVVRFHFGKNPYAPDQFNQGSGGGGLGGMARGGMGGMRGMGSGGGSPGFGASGGASDISYPDQGDRGGGGMASMMSGGGQFGGAGGAGADTGYDAVKALQHPDLVQLDLAGLITIYQQPESEVTEGDAPATDGTTPDETSAETPGDAAAVATPEPAVPGAIEPAAESDTPAAEPVATDPNAAEAAPVDPAGDATTIPTTEAPAVEANPAPAVDATDAATPLPEAPAAESPPVEAAAPQAAPTAP